MSQMIPVMWALAVEGETKLLPGWYLGLDQNGGAVILWADAAYTTYARVWLPLYETWWQ